MPRSIPVSPGCAQCVAAAVQNFSVKWGPCSTWSRKNSIYALFKREIEPAWIRYFEQLPAPLRSRAGGKAFLLSSEGRNRFELFRNQIDEVRRNFTLGRSPALLNDQDSEFLETIETLSEVALECKLKQPAKIRDEKHKLNARRRSSPLCKFCGSLTELEAIFQGQSVVDLEDMPGVSLSGLYCTLHRARLADGSVNPRYQQARRSVKQFEEELARLQRQNTRLSGLRAESGNLDVDRFVLKVIEHASFAGDEEAELRNQAYRLTEQKINDRKKQIVMLRASGKKQNEIAKKLAIWPQIVSKSIRKISPEYRFDSIRPHIEAPGKLELLQRLATDLRIDGDNGVAIIALQDADVTDVMLNPDGGLWTDHRGGGLHKIGQMSASSAAIFVSVVARSLGIVATQKNAVIEGELPFGSFIGVLPPIVDNASFTIRKRK